MKYFITSLFGILAFGSVYAGELLEPVQQIKALPLPEGVSLTDVDSLSNEPVLDFSQKYRDFAFLDPFLMERRKNEIPAHLTMKFETAMEPRQVFLFFKRHFNSQSKMRGAARAKPFYNSRSINSFDVENEADLTNDSVASKAVYYRIDATNGEMRLNIVVFRPSKDEQTVCYLIAQTIKK